MAAKYWIKLYHEMLDDPKMGRLSDRLYRRVIECFLMAGDRDAEGELPPLPDMAWRLRCDQEQLETELVELSRVGILSQHDGGYFVTKFAERQGTMTKAEYMRRRRESDQKSEHYDQTYGDVLPDSYQSVTNGNADKIRIDKKRKEEDSAAAVFAAYEQLCGIGSINKRVGDELGEFIDEVGAAMCIEAIEEAGAQNVRKWPYIKAILTNWRDNGKGSGKRSAKPDVSVLFAALNKPYKEARADLEAVGAWSYVERLGPWEDLKRKTQRDLEFAWRAA